MSEKDLNQDYLTISEFAKFVGITTESLRHYDRKGIFCPATRGTEQKSNTTYRYYSPSQITSVKMLRVLTDIGIPLKQIKELAEMRTPDKMIKLLCENRELVASEIRYLQELHSVINTFTDLLGEAMCATEAEISVAEMPEKRIILGEANDFCNETGFMGEFTRFCDSTLSPKLNLSFPIGGYWDSMDSFLKDPSKPMRFFSIDPKGNESKPAGQYLVGYTRGYYGETNGLPERMAEYASENKLDLSSPVYNIYLSDEISETNPQNYLLQVSTAVSGICRPPMRFAMRKKHITE